MPDITDLRATIIPKSDQLNSEQLLGGPMIITVTEVRAGGGEDQPVSVYHDLDPARPYKPCKTCRKVLILAWGPDGRQWIGRSMELYCDQAVKFGGEEVGGIRISRLTDIPKGIKVSLTATKGRKAMHEIGLLKLSEELHEVLAAIGAAEGKEGLKKAKVMGEALTRPADKEVAVAAYKKRVEALKEKAAGKAIDPADNPATGSDSPPKADAPQVTYARLAERLHAAADSDAAALILDEARVLPAQQQKELQAIHDERWPDAA